MLCPAFITELGAINTQALPHFLNFLGQAPPGIFKLVCDRYLLLWPGRFKAPLKAGHLLLKILNPCIFQNQLLRLFPFLIIKIIGFSNDLFLSRNQLVKLFQSPEKFVQWVPIRLQDHNQTPHGITGALFITSRAHKAVAFEIKKG